MKDSRVSIWLKLIPIFCLVYFYLAGRCPGGALLTMLFMIYLGMDLFISFSVLMISLKSTNLPYKWDAAPVQQEDEEIIDAEIQGINKDKYPIKDRMNFEV